MTTTTTTTADKQRPLAVVRLTDVDGLAVPERELLVARDLHGRDLLKLVLDERLEADGGRV